jgi:hypothetical protein
VPANVALTSKDCPHPAIVPFPSTERAPLGDRSNVTALNVRDDTEQALEAQVGQR